MPGSVRTWTTRPSPRTPPHLPPKRPSSSISARAFARGAFPLSASSDRPARRRSAARGVVLARLLLGALAGALVLSSCDRTVEFHPFDAYRFQQKRAMFLEASLLPPLPEAILKKTEARVEQSVKDSPYLGEVLTRKDIFEKTASRRIERSAYRLLSDTATVLGMTEREISNDVLRIADVDLYVTVQALHLRCPQCDQGDRVAVVGQIFDTKTAQVLWRAHLTRQIDPDIDEATLAYEADDLTTNLIGMMEFLLKPKWHRQRFEHLRHHPREPDAQS